MTTTRTGRWGAVLLFAALSLCAISPASAHSALIGSTPEPDSTIQEMPDEIELEFNESVSDISPAVVLRSGGETVAELEPEIDGSTVTAESPDDLTPGDYAIVWRVVSGDGHPVDGTIDFTLEAGGDEPTQSPEAPSGADSDGSGADTNDPGTSDSGTAGSEVSGDQTEAASAESDGPGTAGIVIIVVVALAIAGTIGWMMWRRRQVAEAAAGGPSDAPTDGTDQ